MRKGFFLTESEKNRISNLYGGTKMFLLEATAPMPTDTPTQIKFADWMDQKHPKWITKNDGTKVNSTNTKIRRNNTWANSNSFKTAWNTYGDDFIKENEKGTTSGGNVNVTQKKEWFYLNGTTPSAIMTIDEMKKAISDGIIKGNTLVYRQGLPGWIKASNAPELGAPPSVPSSTASTNDLSGKMFEPTKLGKRETYYDKQFSSSGSSQQLDKKTPEDLTYRQFNPPGFVAWAKKTLNTTFDEGSVVMDKNMAVVTLTDGSKRYYYYNDKNKEWSIPDFSEKIQISRPTAQDDNK
jgi:hypothetical protein